MGGKGGGGEGEGGTYILGGKRRLLLKGICLCPRGMRKDRGISVLNRRKFKKKCSNSSHLASQDNRF